MIRPAWLDVTGADDISGVGMPNGVFTGKDVTKTAAPYLDLGADTLAVFGGLVPEKWEGLANGTLGAAVAAGFDTGGYALIAGVLHAYKGSAADLVGYTAPVPEPQTCALMLAGLGALGWVRRRRSRG